MDIKGSTLIVLFVLKFFLVSSNSVSLEKKFDIKSHTCKVQFLKQVTLNCSDLNLTYIPKVENDVEVILFSYNNLVNVTSQTFDNVSSPEKVSGLQLDHDKIQRISSDALDRFVNLTYLDLSDNLMSNEVLKTFLGATTKLTLLHTLRLNYMQHINEDIFSLMNGTHILDLAIEGNEMNNVSLQIFEIFSLLRSLSVSRNHMKHLKLWKLPYLKSLDLKDNQLHVIPNFCMNENMTEPFLPQLEILDVSGNGISILDKDKLLCLQKLSHLSIHSNLITTLPTDMLINVQKLTYLDVSHQNIGNFKVEKYAFRSKLLMTLKMAYHDRASSIFASYSKTFEFTTNLEYLSIHSILFSDFNDQEIQRFFSPLRKLVYFSCINCGINQDPKFLLAQKPNLTDLNLSYNYIQKLSEDTFTRNNLTQLRLPGNKIGHISKSTFPEKLLNRLKILNLSLNPFICDCNLKWFINWLRNQMKVRLLYYPKHYKCAYPGSMAGRKLPNVNFSYRECHPWSPWIWVSIAVGVFLIITIIAGLFVYRNRWNIKHYIYLLRKKRNYHQLADISYRYHAFVCYEAEDSEWVRRRLLPVLEEEEGMNLCIHERDFQVGAFINDNIVTNMEASRKIIMILTNAFIRSDWCMFELRVALSKQIEDGTDVIVVLLEGIDARNITSSLRVLLDTTTYVEWTEDDTGQNLFWTQLREATRR